MAEASYDRAWRILVWTSIAILVSIIAVPLGYLVKDEIQNRRAYDLAQEHCERHGAIEILDHDRWLELASGSQSDRLAHPGLYDVSIADRRVVSHPENERVIRTLGTGVNQGRAVIRIDNYQVRGQNLFSRIGLVADFVAYDCLRSGPSAARAVLAGY